MKAEFKSILDKILLVGGRLWHRAEVRAESKFSQRVLEEMRAFGGQWVRVEAGGVPDISFAVGGQEGWIETKIEDEAGRIHFQPLQPAWLSERARHGSGMAWVLVYSPTKKVVLLFSASDAPLLAMRQKDRPTQTSEVASLWPEPLAKEHWLEIFSRMTLGKVKVC